MMTFRGGVLRETTPSCMAPSQLKIQYLTTVLGRILFSSVLMVLAFQPGGPGSNPVQTVYFCHAFVHFFSLLWPLFVRQEIHEYDYEPLCDLSEIMLKVAYNTIQSNNHFFFLSVSSKAAVIRVVKSQDLTVFNGEFFLCLLQNLCSPITDVCFPLRMKKLCN